MKAFWASLALVLTAQAVLVYLIVQPGLQALSEGIAP